MITKGCITKKKTNWCCVPAEWSRFLRQQPAVEKGGSLASEKREERRAVSREPEVSTHTHTQTAFSSLDWSDPYLPLWPPAKMNQGCRVTSFFSWACSPRRKEHTIVNELHFVFWWWLFTWTVIFFFSHQMPENHMCKCHVFFVLHIWNVRTSATEKKEERFCLISEKRLFSWQDVYLRIKRE